MKFLTYDMEMSISYSVCAEIQAKNNIWRIKERNRQDIARAM